MPGSITLEAATTTIDSLTIVTTAGDTVIDPAGQALALRSILLPAGAGGLTIGTGTDNGTLKSAGLPAIPLSLTTAAPAP
jgi:hypothetical protein